MTQLCYSLSVIAFVQDIWLQNQLQSLMAVRFVEEENLKFIQNAWWAKLCLNTLKTALEFHLTRDILL